MKLHSLIPSVVLGAALAASAQTAAPRQPAQTKPASKTEIAVAMAPPNTAENGAHHNLKLQPGSLAQVVEQLQDACTKAAAENGWNREAAAANLLKAKARMAQAKVNADEELEIAGKTFSQAQALAQEAKAAAKDKVATVQAEAEFDHADRAYQRLANLVKQNVVDQQELDDAKAKRDAANGVLIAMREETAQKETAEANLNKAQERLDQARVSADLNAASADLRMALALVQRYQMPNLTYGPGTSEAKVSAALDLVDMPPLDALALIAAAAGCDLTPIYSPPQEGDDREHTIGYSFELTPRRASSSAPMTYRISGGSSGSGSTSTTYPPASHPAPGIASPNGAGQSVPEPLPQAAPPILPPGKSGAGSPKPMAAASTWLIPIEDVNAQGDAQVVRIYALGPVLGGEDPNLEANKENDFKDLILEAMSLAEVNGPPEPKLYFHEKSRVLIARATLRQQEIIDQAVSAMKENDRFVNSSGGNALPQAKPPKP